jgi:hypothetical protein
VRLNCWTLKRRDPCVLFSGYFEASDVLLLQVLNIIAELKTENSVEIIELLKNYGFFCLKYREQYGGVLPSDVPFNVSRARRLTIQHPYAADDDYVHDHPYVKEEVWGVACDEASQSSLKDVEVSVYVSELPALSMSQLAGSLVRARGCLGLFLGQWGLSACVNIIFAAHLKIIIDSIYLSSSTKLSWNMRMIV